MTPPSFNVSTSGASHSHGGQPQQHPRMSATIPSQSAVPPSRAGYGQNYAPSNGRTAVGTSSTSTSSSGYYKNTHGNNGSGIPQGTAPGSSQQLKLHPMAQPNTNLSPVHSPGYSTTASGPSSLVGSNLPPMAPPGGRTESLASHSAMMSRQDSRNRPHSHQVPMRKSHNVEEDSAIASQDSVEKDSPPSSLGEQVSHSKNLSASLQPSRHSRHDYLVGSSDRHKHLPPASQVGRGVQLGSGQSDSSNKGLHSQQDYMAVMGRSLGRSQPVRHHGMSATLGSSRVSGHSNDLKSNNSSGMV